VVHMALWHMFCNDCILFNSIMEELTKHQDIMFKSMSGSNLAFYSVINFLLNDFNLPLTVGYPVTTLNTKVPGIMG